MAQGSFYVTTPIFYINDVPHIGHGYNEVASDFLARWHRAIGDDTWFLTGTDEHGEKILRSAQAAGLPPQEWADNLVESAWKPLLGAINISNDDFIRTTEQRHEDGVRRFIQRLYDRGYIYFGEFGGYYCVSCEEYKNDPDLIKSEDGTFLCEIHKKPVEYLSEQNYFFKLSEFTQPLLDLYAANPDFVSPESRRNEVVSFVKQGLQDLSISRNSFDWGIKIPWDESHVVYVWVDALINYITAIGWGVDDKNFNRRWPATHIVGKDILRFHAVIWPAMLMAAGIEVPKQVFGHGWLLIGGEKMSKSSGTGVSPVELTESYGVDAFRYYFLKAVVFGADGNFSLEDIEARYNAELANGFGNLASRVHAMTVKYFEGKIPEASDITEAEQAVFKLIHDAVAEAHKHVEAIDITGALHKLWTLVDGLNHYLTEQEPWHLAKDEANTSRLATVIRTALEGLRVLAITLSPVMPETSEKLWSALGAKESIGELSQQNILDAASGELSTGSNLGALPVLFPRIEKKD